ncbi:hypothetical protein T06_8764, partial [Trichinella sp. T6]
LSQSSSVRTHPDNELVLVAVSAFRMCYGLRHPMKLVPLATLVHMDIKAFPSCPSVPLLITNSIVHQSFVSAFPMWYDKLCSPGVSMAFSTRPSVPLVITNSKKEFDIMTAVKYVK